MHELVHIEPPAPGDGAARAELTRLREENEQLRRALESRIVTEQAKGVLAERHSLGIDASFMALRGAARSTRMRLHELAREVVASSTTPPPVLDELRRRQL